MKYISGLQAWCPKHKKQVNTALEFDCESHYWGELTGGDHHGKVIVYCLEAKRHALFEIDEDDEYNQSVD
jgi:hypothetical protein